MEEGPLLQRDQGPLGTWAHGGGGGVRGVRLARGCGGKVPGHSSLFTQREQDAPPHGKKKILLG